jgi:predicted CXXCH cytochrome family protein
MTCTTCHDPHQALRGEEADRHYAKVCLGCHESAIKKLVSHKKHPAVQECVGCHMQRRRPSDVMHAVITDHRILSRPVATKAAVEEQHDGNTWPYSGNVVLYYPSALPKTAENELDLALAQVVQQSNLPQDLQRLEKAIRQYQPAGRAETYFQLADAWFRAGQINRSIPWYEEAVKRDPGRWRYLYSLGMAFSAAGQADRSSEALQRARSLAPREPVILYGLADVDFVRGRLPEAISLLRRAIGLNPDLAEGPNNLGNALSRAGNLNGAAVALRDAARLRPEVSSIRINLAGVLARQGKLSDAREELEKALQIGPSREEARSVYLRVLMATANENQARARFSAVLDSQLSDVYNNLGTVLVGLGDTDAAIRHYRSAIAARPDSAAAHLNLGLTLAGQKKLGEAQQALEAAVKYDPDLYEAHLKLGELLVGQGKADSAAAYLRKATLSPDPLVRKAATDLIRSSSAKSN